MAALQRTPFFDAIEKHDPKSTAVVHSLSGRTFKYGSVLHDVANAKERLLEATGKTEGDLVGERVAFLVENSYDYVGALHLGNLCHVACWG
jgi:malonyl-CoA/methylmalonyl-CoA synthetase